MRTVTLIALSLAIISYCQAYDGRYRPEYYSGQYQTTNAPYYRSLAERSDKPFYNAYQPFGNKALERDLLAPFAKYGSNVYQTTAPTATYRTPVAPVVTSTYRPFTYSAPQPYVEATKSPNAVYLKSVKDADATVLREDRTYDENNYHFAYETNNGIAAEESGVVEPSANGVGGGTRVRGFYEYIGDDGLKYRVDYVADENGYRASGAHLPKAPQ